MVRTIYLWSEIFVVKIFSWFCVNHETKKHNIHYNELVPADFCTHTHTHTHTHGFTMQLASCLGRDGGFRFTAQQAMDSYFKRDGLFFDTHRWLMANVWQLYRCLIIVRLYCHGTCLSIPWYPRHGTHGTIASLWICMSTVYKPCTVFLAHQCLLVQIHPHLPINGKNNVHLFNGVSWSRGKWKASSHWGLNGPVLSLLWLLSCNHQVTTNFCNLVSNSMWVLVVLQWHVTVATKTTNLGSKLVVSTSQSDHTLCC